MNNGYIAILDSGIGGFSCLYEAARLLPHERFLYFGDNRNAPYGNKSKSELYRLTQKNLSEILKCDVKAVIIGCNTLSLTVMPIIAPYIKIPFFCVYPPIYKRCGKTALFATPNTCARLKKENGVRVFPLKNLAGDIEKNKADLTAVDLTEHLNEELSGLTFDTVILGCTHYFFIKNQFIDHFCPQKIVSGEKYTAKRLKHYLTINNLTIKSKDFTVDFIGENAEENFNFYSKVVKNMILTK